MVKRCCNIGEVRITRDGGVTKNFNDAHDEKFVMDDCSNWIKSLTYDAQTRGKDYLLEVYHTYHNLIICDCKSEGATPPNMKVDYIYVLVSMDGNDG